MTKKQFFLTFLSLIFSLSVFSEGDIPQINPTMYKCNTSVGDSAIEAKEYADDAPLTMLFKAEPQHAEGWDSYYEWRFYEQIKVGNDYIIADEPYLQRYEENTEYTFQEKKPTFIRLFAIFTRAIETEDSILYETVSYDQEFWDSPEATNMTLFVTVYDSQLYFPNAFSPNGDGVNDIFRANRNFQSIVEFHAMIFNRWGQKIYEWYDPEGGWDGTQNGHPVKEGVYFLYCKAKGADGRKFTFKKDVNLMRTYLEDVDTGSGGSGI